MTPRRAQLRQAPANAITTTDPLVRELFLRARQRGLSDTTLESLVGYSRIAIYYARRGNRNPKLPFVRDLAAALGYKLILVPERTVQNAEPTPTPDLARSGNHPRLEYVPLRWAKTQPHD